MVEVQGEQEDNVLDLFYVILDGYPDVFLICINCSAAARREALSMPVPVPVACFNNVRTVFSLIDCMIIQSFQKA